jgi:predicted acylesterase/phospholipase RssA
VSDERVVKRALILSGGGLKVAFQAGVLQVWLDEIDKDKYENTFHMADGASGGVFNLAMWCQGMSGTEIANAWRRTNPLDWFGLSLEPWRSISSLERLRKNVFPVWSLDWEKINKPERGPATFNVYNFTKQRLETFGPHEMTEDLLLAGVTLPMWFPPAVTGEDVAPRSLPTPAACRGTAA